MQADRKNRAVENYSQVVICATQRSGSTMVCEDLNLVGCGNPNEYFLNWKPKKGVDWEKELDAILEKRSVDGRFAVKIMANQLRDIDACLATFQPASDYRRYPHLTTFFKDALWIYVYRDDLLGQAISHYVARNTGTYHAIRRRIGFIPGRSKSASNIKDATVPYDFKEIVREWDAFVHQNLLWSEFFRDNGIKPLVVNYEKATGDEGRLEYLAKLAGQTGIVLPDPLPARNLLRMPGNINKELRARVVEDLFKEN